MAATRGSSRQAQKETWLNTAGMHPAVRGQLGNSVSLSAFMKKFSQEKGLSKTDRLRLVEQALVLLEMNYVHLPLKRAIHAVDPIRRLELLKFNLEEMNYNELPSEMQFHDEMETIFTSTRDLHTNYLLPAPFNQKTAYLPFLIEEYFESNRKERKFLVSHLAEWFPQHPTFKKGVEVLYWNGVRIRRAIEINGESQAGSNLEARFARGLDALTIRPLIRSLPPDEEWVVITHSSPDGPMDIELRWQVFTPQPDGRAAPASSRQRATALGLDIKKAAINEARKILFAPHVVRARKGTVGAKTTKASVEPFRDWVEVEKSRLPGTFRAWKVKTRYGTFAYIRIFAFQTANNRAGTVRFVREFRRLIEALPQTGLIIDVRGNGGGNINAGEQLLQLLTPRQIKPELFEMINTSLNLKISRVDKELRIWRNSLKEAVLTDASYSHGFPLTSEESCNEIGQIYYGPVVLITDALCYSTTDMFAAGFQDHGIGEILGTSGNTGAGGANVWEHRSLRALLSKSAKSPFKPLPKGAGMRVAFRRSIRVGGTAGRPLEELGVVPKVRHYMTMNDLLHDNEDLIDQAAELLASKKVYCLSAKVYYKRDGTLTVSAITKDISRLDLYIDDCPIGPCKVVNNKAKFEKVTLRWSGSKPGRILVLKGFERNKLVAAFRKKLSYGSRRHSARPR